MKYLMLVLLAGCSTINIYTKQPVGNACVDNNLRARNYCTSEEPEYTAECYKKIKKECNYPNIVFK